MEAAGGLYFAQARRYDAETGRFISEDKMPGFTSASYTLNRYNYCWNNPLILVDLDGYKPKKIKGEDSGNENNYSTEINYDTPIVTFCVDAPEEGSRNAINNELNVGHTFIIIDYGNGTTYSRGFYPQNPLSTNEIISQIDVTGEVRDDATFAVEALQSIGIDVPTTEHKWTLPIPKWLLRKMGADNLKGYSPADAAMDIREYKENCETD